MKAKHNCLIVLGLRAFRVDSQVDRVVADFLAVRAVAGSPVDRVVAVRAVAGSLVVPAVVDSLVVRAVADGVDRAAGTAAWGDSAGAPRGLIRRCST